MPSSLAKVPIYFPQIRTLVSEDADYIFLSAYCTGVDVIRLSRFIVNKTQIAIYTAISYQQFFNNL